MLQQKFSSKIDIETCKKPTQKEHDALFIRLQGIRDSLATADLISWE